MAYKKPQDPLTNNGFGIYPLTTADQVILSDGSRLEKNGSVNLVTLPTTEETPGEAPTINAGTFGGMTVSQFVEMIYPVGSIYISASATNPETLFGGTWEQLKDRFLLGAGDSYAAGGTGGEATHTLTGDELPSHIHGVPSFAGDTVNGGGWSCKAINSYDESQKIFGTLYGDNHPHNNMPPYLAVYMWQRMA